MCRRLLIACWAFLLLAAPALAQRPTGQSEFVPVNDLPPTEQIPAAALLVAGYAFIWVAVAFYLWTIWRRLNRVEADMRSLSQKTARR